MKISIRKGFSFGITSSIITTLGIMIGLNASTHSSSIIIGGILIIAIADALSDSLAIHISEESGSKTTTVKEVWESTISTFLFKFIFALTFMVPVLIFELYIAIIISIIWALSLLIILSIYIAKKQKLNPYMVVFEHLIIAIAVILITHYLGDLIGKFG